MPREIIFNGRKPSKQQILKHVRLLMKDGWHDIHVCWGENRIEIENIHGYWHGSGWIRNISGYDLANFELNERRAA
jgi:uncharacterized protein YukJ